VDVGGGRQDRRDLRAREAAQVLEQLAVERVRGRDHERAVPPLEGEDRVLARERAREGPGDELGIELQRVDLPVVDPERLGDRLRRLVLVDGLAVAARVREAERGEDLDRRQLRPAEAAPAAAGGPVAEQPGALRALPGERGPPGVVGEDPLLREELRDELEGVVAGAVGPGHARGVYPERGPGSQDWTMWVLALRGRGPSARPRRAEKRDAGR
jgi:hypothetical protein